METKWRLNVNLLKNIFEVARRPKLASLEAANIKPSTWNGWVAAEAEEPGAYTREAGGIPVRALIAICNVLGIPVSRMFVREGEDEVIPLREELVVKRSSFVLNTFDLETFRKAFGKRSHAGKSIENMMKELGYSFTMYTAWVGGAGNLRMSQMLHFCGTFGYDLFSFVVDGNVAPVFEEPAEGVKDDMDDLVSKCEKLELKNNSLSRKNATLKAERDAISKECEELKVQKLELEYEVRRLKEYIKQMESGFPSMAAENDFPEWKRGDSKEKLV